MELCTFADLIARRRDLEDQIRGAMRMRSRAYAPYSKFRVGVMIAVDNFAEWAHSTRLWFAGCNVENVSYEVTHAEQSAIALMLGKLGSDPKPIIARVVVACVAERPGKHALPCGLCRQWIAEFGTPQTEIFGVRLSENGENILGVECTTLGELLPYTFTL